MSAALPGVRRPPVRTSLAVGAAGLALLVAACAPSSPPPNVPIQAQSQIVLNVVDSVNDVGLAPSIALDANGNPSVSYLLFTHELKAGEIANPIVPGQPQPPAVLMASEKDGTWLRQSVTPQKTVPAEGDAPELVDADGKPLEGVITSMALDKDGHAHVVWGSPKGLFYATNTSGAFAAAERIAGSGIGAAIAVDDAGTPWVSYYLGGAVKVASRASGSWSSEDAAALVGVPRPPARTTDIALASDGTPVVAYGDEGSTFVATRSGGAWSSQQIPGDGGYAVSLAVDSKGATHVAYVDSAGGVHEAHGSGGGQWEVSDLGTAGQPPSGGSANPYWGTSVAVDDQGVHEVAWADVDANDIKLASDAGGQFEAQDVQGSTGGATPSLAVSPDGKSSALAWFGTFNANLVVALPKSGSLVVAFSPLPVPSASGPSPTPSGPQCQPTDSTDLTISSPSVTGFDPTCLAVTADTAFTVTLDNTDPSVIHNWELFTDSSAATRVGGANGPSDVVAPTTSATYNLDALDPGTYYFHCDIHPTTMQGVLEVVGK
jgi:plastocyanin